MRERTEVDIAKQYFKLTLEAEVDDLHVAFDQALAVLMAEGESETDARAMLMTDGEINAGMCLLALVGPVQEPVGWRFHGGTAVEDQTSVPLADSDPEVSAPLSAADPYASATDEIVDDEKEDDAKEAGKTVALGVVVTVKDADLLYEATKVNVAEGDEEAMNALVYFDLLDDTGQMLAMLAHHLLTELEEFGCEVGEVDVLDSEPARERHVDPPTGHIH